MRTLKNIPLNFPARSWQSRACSWTNPSLGTCATLPLLTYMSEIIISGKSIDDSVQHVHKVAGEHTLKSSNNRDSLDKVHNFESPFAQNDAGKQPTILSNDKKGNA